MWERKDRLSDERGHRERNRESRPMNDKRAPKCGEPLRPDQRIARDPQHRPALGLASNRPGALDERGSLLEVAANRKNDRAPLLWKIGCRRVGNALKVGQCRRDPPTEE